MECIYNNKITTITSTNEDPNYPWSNMLDEHPKQWGSSDPADDTPHLVTIEMTVTNGGQAFGIFNTNAKTVVYTLIDRDDVVVETKTFDLASAKTYEEFFSGEISEIWTFIYHPYPYQLGNHKVRLALTGAVVGQPVYVGVAVAGNRKQFINPNRGIQESLVDYSVEETTNNGSFYYEKREVVRKFTGGLSLQVDTELYTMLYNLGQQIGKQPLAWKITDFIGSKWTVYARFDQLPSATHNNITFGAANFSLLEVI